MTSTLKRSERTMPLRELTSAPATPLATVHANLMPPEVVAKRRLGWLKRRLAFVLIALVALVGVAYGLAHQQTAGSQDDLSAEQGRTGTLTQQVKEFDDLLLVQTRIAGLRTQLASVMTGDLQWSRLLGRLNSTAPAGLKVTAVTGDVGGKADTTAPAAAPSGLDPAVPVVGTLTISGTARDYKSVATYVDTLAKVTGLVDVDPGTVTSEGGKSTFSLTASLTAKVLGGRFAKTGTNGVK